jgi:hypothetical protein
MNTTTTSFVQALEPRRLLSTTPFPADTEAPADPAVEVVAEEWVPYVPTALQTDVDVVQREGRAVAVVTITFSDAGYRVTDWGTPVREGNTFTVDAKVERWTGGAPLVITPVTHEYPLGELPPGQYLFNFNAWGKPVESEAFTVPNDTPVEQWVPYTPTEQQTTIDILRREGKTVARVKIVFPSSGFRVDWGTVTRDGDTFRANAEVDMWTGPALTVMTPMVHEYVLGELPGGGYTFEFAARGTVVERRSFAVDEGPVWVPYQPTAEHTDIEIYQREGRWKARVKLTFSDNGFRVADWGVLRREGNTFIADAKVERTGGVLPVVTYASNEYDLGELLAGEYAFNFNAWGKHVEGEAFVVKDGHVWVPYTPTAEQTEIDVFQTDTGRWTARVTLMLPDNGFRVDWGTVSRTNDGFIAAAKVEYAGGPLPVVTEHTHEYDLGPLMAGEYPFHFTSWGTLVESARFTVPTSQEEWVPYTPAAEQTEIEIHEHEGKRIAVVAITFPDAGYRVDWGTLAREGNTFRADAKVDRYLGPAPAVITTKRQEYLLGALEPGTYTFEFSARGVPVESATFSVPAQADHAFEGHETLADHFRFFTDASGDPILLFWNNDPAMRPGPLPIPRDQYDRFLVHTLGGDDTVEIDLVQQTPLPKEGMVYAGGAGADVLQISNALATDRIEIAGDRVVINGVPIELVSVEKIVVDRASGSDVTVGGTDVVDLNAGQYLGSITVKDDALVRLTGDATQVSLSTLSVSDSGLLDVRDKTVMLMVAASEAQATLATLHELIAAGREGNWTGGRGITSSLAASDQSGAYGIGVSIVPSPLLSATAADVEVIALRYTLMGDLNLDGVVNADDYFKIDAGFLARPLPATYAEGDVNYDGKIDADDYFLVDSTFLSSANAAASASASTGSNATAAATRAGSAPFSRQRVSDDRSVTRRRKSAARVAADVL